MQEWGKVLGWSKSKLIFSNMRLAYMFFWEPIVCKSITSMTVYVFIFSLPTGFSDELSFMYYKFLEEGVAMAKQFN